MHFVNTYWIFFCVVKHAFAQEDKVSYEGTQLWHADLHAVGDIILIKKLIDSQDISAWSLSPVHADFVVRPEDMVKVQTRLLGRNISFSVPILNLQQRVDAQKAEPLLWNENTLRIGHRLDWNSYPPLNIIEEYYNFLAEDYSSLCKVQTIGVTAENRTIKMINITNGNPKNKVILITGGVHGREWVSISSVLYVVHTIVTKFDQQSDYIKSKNWLIVPVVNPDGYKFTHSHDRLWRKNRRKFIYCKGADINRNFEIDWGIAGITENNECRESYAGPFPFSEAETVAVRGIIKKMKNKVSAMVDVHSYGNMILYPWSARSQQTQDLHTHEFTAKGMVQAIQNATGQKYTFGPTYHKIYPATGSLLDWAYSQGVKHSYAFEVRDLGQFGFLLPPEQIESTGIDLYTAVEFLANILDPPMQHRRDGHDESWF